MSRLVRVAMTQTKNRYEPMPDTVDGLASLEGALEAIRALDALVRERTRGTTVV